MKKISIVVPIYNEEKVIPFFKNRILNIIKKEEKYEIEVLFVDDGSNDKSIEIIKEYNVKLLNSNRIGAGGARNKGLDIASGKYIILLDGDDYLYKNDVLEKLDKQLDNQDIVKKKKL